MNEATATRMLIDDLQAFLDRAVVKDSLYDAVADALIRWRARTDPPNAGRAFSRQLGRDYTSTLRDLFRLSKEDQRLMTDAYIAYYRQIGGVLDMTADQLLMWWKDSVTGIRRDATASGPTVHHIPPTNARSEGDYNAPISL